jgi:hypothetical protein
MSIAPVRAEVVLEPEAQALVDDERFAGGYHLTAKAMAWFWDCHLPDVERRSEPFASPLRATEAVAQAVAVLRAAPQGGPS